MIETRVAIVSGASAGLGSLTALSLAENGYHVYAGVRDLAGRNADTAKVLRQEASSRGTSLEAVELDVTDDDSVRRAVEQVIAETGRVDVAVNNAGVLYAGVSEAFTVEQVRAQLDVNVLGPVRLNRAVLPHMRGRGSGLLVHVSSLAGRVVFPFMGIYGASKYALEALAESYRYELSSFGIDSVIVEPGPFPTNAYAATTGPQDGTRAAAYGPVGDIPAGMRAWFQELFAGDGAPNPQDVADAVVSLAETPAGQRPLRTVVGLDFGVRDLNKTLEPFADNILRGLQLEHLAAIPAAVR